MSQVIQKIKGMTASDGAGVKLKRVIGQPMLKRLDPFLMLDEFGSDTAEDYIAGFPQHPHRGFQTVTYMLNGKMGHRDSVGNEGIIEDGGLQWMNAGRGIIHEEMPKQTHGKMRGFQLWVNLPAKEKMSPPAYEDIPSAQIPEISLSEDAKLRVLAGRYDDTAGPVKAHAVQAQFYDIHLGQLSRFSFASHSQHNAFIYVYEGSIKLGDTLLSKGELGVLKLSEMVSVENHGDDSRFIYVSGAPINEPIAQYGPFVMNTEAEIQQAIRDFQSGVLA